MPPHLQGKESLNTPRRTLDYELLTCYNGSNQYKFNPVEIETWQCVDWQLGSAR